MQAYPAYTVKKIEDELSWRMFKKLMDCWKEQKPNFMTNQRIEDILMKAHGMIEVKKDEAFKPMDENAMFNKFREKGWLS